MSKMVSSHWTLMTFETEMFSLLSLVPVFKQAAVSGLRDVNLLTQVACMAFWEEDGSVFPRDRARYVAANRMCDCFYDFFLLLFLLCSWIILLTLITCIHWALTEIILGYREFLVGQFIAVHFFRVGDLEISFGSLVVPLSLSLYFSLLWRICTEEAASRLYELALILGIHSCWVSQGILEFWKYSVNICLPLLSLFPRRERIV